MLQVLFYFLNRTQNPSLQYLYSILKCCTHTCTCRNYGISLNILHICKNGKRISDSRINKFFCFVPLEIIFFQTVPVYSCLFRLDPLRSVLFRCDPVCSGLCRKIPLVSHLRQFKIEKVSNLEIKILRTFLRKKCKI